MIRTGVSMSTVTVVHCPTLYYTLYCKATYPGGLPPLCVRPSYPYNDLLQRLFSDISFGYVLGLDELGAIMITGSLPLVPKRAFDYLLGLELGSS